MLMLETLEGKMSCFKYWVKIADEWIARKVKWFFFFSQGIINCLVILFMKPRVLKRKMLGVLPVGSSGVLPVLHKT
jgi:hypothetical protein